MLKYINITFSINNLKKFNCVKILIFLKKKIFKILFFETILIYLSK